MFRCSNDSLLLVFFLTILLTSFAGCAGNKAGLNVKPEFPKSVDELEQERVGKLFGRDIVLWSSSGNNFFSDIKNSGKINTPESAEVKALGAVGVIDVTETSTDKASNGNAVPQQQVRNSNAAGLRTDLRDLVTASKKTSKNPYLWEAALVSMASFMPLAIVDAANGLIVTEWYQPDVRTLERYKYTVLVGDNGLNPKNLKVVVFKEMKRWNSNWVAVDVPQAIKDNLEEKILINANGLLKRLSKSK